MIIAETKNLILREFEPEDVDSLYEIYKDNDNFLVPLCSNRQEEKEKLEAYIKYVYGFYGFGLWAVIEKKSQKLIGQCGLSVEEINDQGELEIGYVIAREWQNKGYATESIKAVLNYAWEDTAEARVAARIDVQNYASKAVAQKNGFKYSGMTDYRGRQAELYFYDIPERLWD